MDLQDRLSGLCGLVREHRHLPRGATGGARGRIYLVFSLEGKGPLSEETLRLLDYFGFGTFPNVFGLKRLEAADINGPCFLSKIGSGWCLEDKSPRGVIPHEGCTRIRGPFRT